METRETSYVGQRVANWRVGGEKDGEMASWRIYWNPTGPTATLSHKAVWTQALSSLAIFLSFF